MGCARQALHARASDPNEAGASDVPAATEHGIRWRRG